MNNTKRLMLFGLLLVMQTGLLAQNYFNGKLINAKSSDEVIYYDRTQYPLTSTSFRSVYKIFDVNKGLIYTATITHDQVKASFVISLKKEGEELPSDLAVKYDRKKC